MSRIIPALVAGLAVGGAIGYFATVERVPPVRDIATEPNMTAAVAEQLRERRYAVLDSIEDVQALPSGFRFIDSETMDRLWCPV